MPGPHRVSPAAVRDARTHRAAGQASAGQPSVECGPCPGTGRRSSTDCRRDSNPVRATARHRPRSRQPLASVAISADHLRDEISVTAAAARRRLEALRVSQTSSVLGADHPLSRAATVVHALVRQVAATSGAVALGVFGWPVVDRAGGLMPRPHVNRTSPTAGGGHKRSLAESRPPVPPVCLGAQIPTERGDLW